MLGIILTLISAALPPEQVLVSTENVLSLPEVLLVDARPAEAYTAGHIPGAVHIDSETLSETRDGVRGLLKPAHQVVSLLAGAGVDPSRHIVVYSAMNEATEVKNAARLFWILEYLSYPRVSVLNGGIAKWTQEGRPLETGAARPNEAKSEWNLKTRPELIATRDEVLDAVENAGSTLLDLRSPEEYAGLSKKDFINQSGHIPGACNLPASDVVKQGPFFLFKSPDELRASITEAGASATKPIITYCNTGRDASTGYLGLRLQGIENISVYDGSMAEWGNQKPQVQLQEKK